VIELDGDLEERKNTKKNKGWVYNVSDNVCSLLNNFRSYWYDNWKLWCFSLIIHCDIASVAITDQSHIPIIEILKIFPPRKSDYESRYITKNQQVLNHHNVKSCNRRINKKSFVASIRDIVETKHKRNSNHSLYLFLYPRKSCRVSLVAVCCQFFVGFSLCVFLSVWDDTECCLLACIECCWFDFSAFF